MSLIQQWEDIVTAIGDDVKGQQKFWTDYYMLEKGIYEKMLTQPVEVVSGTVKELADKYETTPVMMAGFLDGINESIAQPNDIDSLEENTVVTVDIDLEKLYYNMVAAKADWLYNLEQWNDLISEERRQELYKAQKKSMTIVKGKKVGRNDPCPCGSGKKYKFCCGR